MSLSCQFCGLGAKTNRSRAAHQRSCKNNPNRIKPVFSNRVPWNKGLTKESDHRVASLANQISESMQELVAYRKESGYWTEERRNVYRDAVKRHYAENPDAHPNRRMSGNRGKMTYPELVAYDYLSELGLEFEHQKKVSEFFVDFLIGNTIIEIDGEHWHPIGNERDSLRDSKLQELGYKVHRIRSKDLIRERIKEILSPE